MNSPSQSPDSSGPKLLLTTRQAAAALSLCEKSVWSLTKSGALPAVRIGRAVRYSLTDLEAFIAGQKAVSQ